MNPVVAGHDSRCPDCRKLVGVPSADYVGDVALFCRRSKTRFGSTAEDLPRLLCPGCRTFLASGVIRAGSIGVVCPRCALVVAFGPDGGRLVETPAKTGPKLRPKPIADDDLVAYIESRWRALRMDRAHRSADLAVGLRFDVFARDGFRCRYCGRTPDDGAVLEADHVIARAAGGPDTLDNLVTACWECNRGKSDKALDTAVHSFH